ncbi:MAG: beta-N-acetylhexosaminidase [Acetobacteraceae bacterium]
MKAAIVGIAGPDLRPEEAALFQALPPAGVILFKRNIQDPAQLVRLTATLRAALPPGAELMVDQEGGRVARLRPPHWRDHPSAGAIGMLPHGSRSAWLTGALIGADCAEAGFTVAAAPVLDLRVAGAHEGVVGDRSFGSDPEHVARLGRAMAEGLMAAGVMPVGKHCPGHGRAQVDSHHALPHVHEADLDADIRPFVLNSNLPWLMTAHIVYDALDPDRPATLSPRVIETVIRGRIGFKGVLVTDDLAMNALSGAPAQRAVSSLAAGCDLALYCSGDFADNQAVLRAVPAVTPAAAARLAAARTLLAARRQPIDAAALAAERDSLLA